MVIAIVNGVVAGPQMYCIVVPCMGLVLALHPTSESTAACTMVANMPIQFCDSNCICC